MVPQTDADPSEPPASMSSSTSSSTSSGSATKEPAQQEVLLSNSCTGTDCALQQRSGFTRVTRYIVDLFALEILPKQPEADETPTQDTNALLLLLASTWYKVPPQRAHERGTPAAPRPPRYLRASVPSLRRMYSETSLARVVSLCSALLQVQARRGDVCVSVSVCEWEEGGRRRIAPNGQECKLHASTALPG